MFKIHERYARIIGIPSLGIFLSFIFCPVMNVSFIVKSILLVFIFWQGLYAIITYFRRRFPEIKQTSKRLLYSIFSAIGYIIIADSVFRWFFHRYFPELDWELTSLPLHFLKNFFISMLVAMIYELTYFYSRWNQANLEAEQLKTQQITSQLESLKNQISPHFLFNSLNTLAAIIPEDQNQAVLFTEKLSEVYRYILQYKDKELVQLSTELDFIKSFLFLLKIRYPNNLSIEYDIKSSSLQQHIAPLTLQILVENVIKHNVISKSSPLTIEIYTDKNNHINVRNLLNLKTIATGSTKMGLENIRKRYQYLTDKAVKIIKDQQQFLVTIPLITINQESSHS